MNQRRSRVLCTALLAFGFGAGTFMMSGCEVDSFFDPSKTLYGQNYPTTTPILDRIDAIERGIERDWAAATDVTPEDLLPSDLEYRLVPGDVVSVEVQDLVQPGMVRWPTRIDQAGNIRLPPPVRDFPAAGLTLRELEDNLVDYLEDIIRDPFVNVSLDVGQGFFFTISGNIGASGTFPLTRPDLRLDQALGFAGGAPITTHMIYIVRPVVLAREYEPFPDRPRRTPPDVETPPIDIDELIEEIERGDRDNRGGGGGGVNPGMLDARQSNLADSPPIEIIDIDNLELRRLSDENHLSPTEFTRRSSRQGGSAAASGSLARAGESFVFIEERGWVRRGQQDPGDDVLEQMLEPRRGEVVLERIIRVPYKKLLSDGSYNVVIRPGDRIYVQPPMHGVVYIGGEVLRPGVYQLPVMGELTLSRLVTAAGGFGPLAIPSRVDFTRRVGEGREATIRLNLGAIRQKTEPDIAIKPDDHIIVGTSWVAAPLAIIRNGFRATYGFGFLLDRNFGNDVFGAPPTNFRSN